MDYVVQPALKQILMSARQCFVTVMMLLTTIKVTGMMLLSTIKVTGMILLSTIKVTGMILLSTIQVTDMILLSTIMLLIVRAATAQHELGGEDIGGDVELDTETIIGGEERDRMTNRNKGMDMHRKEEEKSFTEQTVLALQQLGVVIGEQLGIFIL